MRTLYHIDIDTVRKFKAKGGGGGGHRVKENNILYIGTIFEFDLLQTFNATSNNTMIFIYTFI